ncbi:hypothetical protein JCGZ_13562 [Jatropha curcas]|uniref:Uncharacterized protein n=1 Tax=Jatropha curcas TaxID=180498 RepID=A0A067KLH7_JATCU|nr:hypothetical protein JCGZ_13562 [Jatropha curcas]
MEDQENVKWINVPIRGIRNQEVDEVPAQNDGSASFLAVRQKEALTAIEEALVKEDDSDAQALDNNQALMDIEKILFEALMCQEQQQETLAGLGPQEQNNVKEAVVEKQKHSAAAQNIKKPSFAEAELLIKISKVESFLFLLLIEQQNL